MYISNLEIKNFRNFNNFSIKLKPLTLIIGENNIGKSNLLEAICLILNQEVSFFKRRILEESDFNNDCLVQLKKQILDNSTPIDDIEYPEIEIKITLTDWDEDQESVIGDWFCNPSLTEAELTYLFSPITKFDKQEEIKQQRQFIEDYKKAHGEEAFNQLSESEKLGFINFPIGKYHYNIYGGPNKSTQANTYHLNQLKFELLDALRDAKTELMASNSNRLLFRVLNAKEDSEYQDLKAELVGLQKAVDENTTLNKIKTNITKQLDKISLTDDSTTNAVDFIFSLPNIEDILKKLSLIYGNNPVKLEKNGTGRNNLLYISLILSFIEDKNSANPTYFRLVGIEEPEAHLHPNLQDHLASNIESLIRVKGKNELRKDIQLLLTSHSTHITTKIDFDNTVVLYKHDSNVKPHYILDGFDNTAEARRKINYLNKYFDAINTNIFYSRKIILVEGISEKLLLPVFYKLHTKKSVEACSCCVINVNGLAFSNFLDIIKNGYFQKCLVLTDSDEGTRTENRAENLQTNYSSIPHIKVCITSESTFEKDIIKSNSNGKGKEKLLNVLKKVRPNLGKTYESTLGTSPITNIDEFFNMIEDYKSDFAYHLMNELDENGDGFVIPDYVVKGIDFLGQ